MAEVIRYAPGRFCFAELATTDQENAKKFYSGLFGWATEDQPIGEGKAYTMFRLHGNVAAAGYTLSEEQQAQATPPYWGLYVNTDNIQACTAKAKELGGTAIMEPFEVAGSGHIAVLADPTGSVFCLWQGADETHIGATVANEPGATGWHELVTDDIEKAGTFYCRLFGWDRQFTQVYGSSYTTFTHQGERVCGMTEKPAGMAQVPAHWKVYFTVADCNTAVAKAGSLGGQVFVEPTDIMGVGRFAMIQDPQGAVFCVLQPTEARTEPQWRVA